MFFETYVDRKKEFRWRLKAKNGKILASGESYKKIEARDKVIGMIDGGRNLPIKPVEK